MFPLILFTFAYEQIIVTAAMAVCGSSGVAFSDPCVRASWAALLPFILAGICSLRLLPLPTLPKEYSSRFQPYFTLIRKYSPFTDFLTFDEAECLLADSKASAIKEPSASPPRDTPRSLILAGPSFVLALVHLGFATFDFSTTSPWRGVLSIFHTLTWTYAAVRACSVPIPIPELFVIYVAQTVGAILRLGGLLFDSTVGRGTASGSQLWGLAIYLAILAGLLGVITTIPLRAPTGDITTEDIVRLQSIWWSSGLTHRQGSKVSPEDYTSLYDWMTFHWVNPMIQKVRANQFKLLHYLSTDLGDLHNAQRNRCLELEPHTAITARFH